MRKSMTRVLLLALILALLCVGAMAAGDKDTTKVDLASGYMVTPLTESGAEARLENGKYVDVAKFQLTYEAKEGEQLVMLLLGKDDAVPTANNIYYIDQKSQSANGTCTFTIYPKQLTSGTYRLMVASQTSETAATIVYDAAYVLGDVDSDGFITPSDAATILQYTVDKATLTATQLLAADVDNDKAITPSDAAGILQYTVEKIKDFSEIQS